jgi:uncharacterized protein (TIGR03435 family)
MSGGISNLPGTYMAGKKKTIVLVAVVFVLVLTGATVALKLIYFPSVKDAWFQLSAQKLKDVPGGLVIVRPTHFPQSFHKGVIMTGVKGTRWVLGRNVSLQQLMATACNFNPARVVLPPDAPTNHFDFLVTTPSNQDEHLRQAVRQKIGCVAHLETRTMDVLALKIVDARLPGLTVSDASEKQKVRFENRKINFTHMPLTVVTGELERMLNTPVVDTLGLTNLYDYSMVWNEQTQRQMRIGTMTRETADKILAAWGLGLQADTASITVLLVEKTTD